MRRYVWGFVRSLLSFGLSGNIFVGFVVNNEQWNKHVLEWDWTNWSTKKKIKKIVIDTIERTYLITYRQIDLILPLW